MSDLKKYGGRGFSDEVAVLLEEKDSFIEGLMTDVLWAATHRSELTDLRQAFSKAEEENKRLSEELSEAKRLLKSAVEVTGDGANKRVCSCCLCKVGRSITHFLESPSADKKEQKEGSK